MYRLENRERHTGKEIVKDYLVDGDQVDEKIIKQLELDTSLVNITQAGTYTYTIKYNKKNYLVMKKY